MFFCFPAERIEHNALASLASNDATKTGARCTVCLPKQHGDIKLPAGSGHLPTEYHKKIVNTISMKLKEYVLHFIAIFMCCSAAAL